MKKSLQSLVLLLMALMVPVTATAAYDQLVDGVYMDGTTLYITSGVTSLGDLQINPSEIYCYATIPPACVSNTFTGYGATLHVPAAGMVSYFTALYWYNFNNILSDAIEPLSVTMNAADVGLEIGQQLSLSATVAPGDATPKTVYWSSSDASVATVSAGGTVTAVAAGECDILATCVDKMAVCHVSVVSPRVTISLDKHGARLPPNHTITLMATCSPIDVDLVVTSSNPGVAIPRLVNGSIMVVGVSEGIANITVDAADGNGSPDSCVVTVYTEPGDVNSDGYVNISDVTALIDYLLSGNPSGVNLTGADCNNDGGINISDVTTLIDYLLSGRWPWQHDMPFTVNGVSFKMVYVEGGTFTMGAPLLGSGFDDDEKPEHQVTISSFSIGQTEVTQDLWVAVMGSNPSYFTGNTQCPVESVSWNDCQEFIAKLNEMTGKTFRLPTEAEWEFAARGGNKSQGYKYAGSDILEEVAWYTYNCGFATRSVATRAPNELGLYDMSGNVFEWCQDWYGSYSESVQIDPVGPAFGLSRVHRGGGWAWYSGGCRVLDRDYRDALAIDNDQGLRLALDSETSPKFQLSETVVIVEPDESKTIHILNGSGDYSTDGGSEYVDRSISGNDLTVTGTAVGTNTVLVIDNAYGAIAVLTVIVDPKAEHEYVDLGLPSGTLWATCNVGASSPEEYGDYFAWGETTPKDYYGWSNYKWCNGSSISITKYCTESEYGTVDDKTELEPEDDVARVNWGPLWRMPDTQQLLELVNVCTWTWTQQKGINGRLVTGPNGNSIFFPAAGSYGISAGLDGDYWSRTLRSSYPCYAYGLDFGSGNVYWNGYYSRCDGHSVRAVRVPQN